MNISKATILTPLGPMLLAATPNGLAGSWFLNQKHFPAQAEQWIEANTKSHPHLLTAQTQIDEYFAGKRRTFSLTLAPSGTAFQSQIWSAISRIGFGETKPYLYLAQTSGRAAASRAAGAATGKNPLSIIVPCHRVVATSGALTGYAGGLQRKQQLLAFEAATLRGERPAFTSIAEVAHA